MTEAGLEFVLLAYSSDLFYTVLKTRLMLCFHRLMATIGVDEATFHSLLPPRVRRRTIAQAFWRLLGNIQHSCHTGTQSLKNWLMITIHFDYLRVCVIRADWHERGHGATGRAVRRHHHHRDTAARSDGDTAAVTAVSFSFQSFFKVKVHEELC